MKRKLLYHPTILIPIEWLKFSILYCDKVGSIVPYNFEYDDDLNKCIRQIFTVLK
ncbi:hypothetical protein [Tepidibacter mesophilus]|uniref:hypothetical protein n=1 Tax=Tepidibacter mesophilus TaxID=655607 RepID=UPI0016513320|nr:hypothetical protein [Tepidibacter mesophilus]